MKKLIAASSIALTLLFTSTAVITPAPSASAKEIYATNGSRTVDIAKSYIGRVKYSFGVKNTSKLILDCSSFTQLVFKKNGMSLPWSSKGQASFGTRVPSKSRLAIGDLVMFSVGTPGVINHVGIYVGNGKFISNTKSSGVTITSLNTGYWGSRYITGRHY
ncbi:C40 family peptidase [Cohnella lupini]|nr:C40 family peptidase [Cohnella lupini]